MKRNHVVLIRRLLAYRGFPSSKFFSHRFHQLQVSNAGSFSPW